MSTRATRSVSALLLLGIALALVSAGAGRAFAQSYPSRQIRLVVPFAAGGPADLLGRVIAEEMSKDLGQQVFVDNRPGANTIIGAELGAKADPDGYTLLMAIDGTLVMNPFLYSKLSYDPFVDFAPITLIARVPSVIEASPGVPANTVRELIELAKTKPGELLMGYSTPTSQVSIELLSKMAGVKFTLVPYRGGTTLVTALLGGEIALGHESLNVSLPFARAGKLKIIALTADDRTAIAPEIPTIAETLPGFDLGIWQGIVAPAKTPTAILDKLHDEIVAVLSREAVRNTLLTAGVEPAISKSPQDFASFIRSQAEIRRKVIEAIGLKLD
ncbi:MAG: tripartite tricarboxylate transporter substrate binding protein [Xanthobacteraceae bacterium]